MVRTDSLGITSVVRSLALRPDTYEPIIKFFRASSWSLERIQSRWQETVAAQTHLFRIRGRSVLVCDGVKQPKEGRSVMADWFKSYGIEDACMKSTGKYWIPYSLTPLGNPPAALCPT